MPSVFKIKRSVSWKRVHLVPAVENNTLEEILKRLSTIRRKGGNANHAMTQFVGALWLKVLCTMFCYCLLALFWSANAFQAQILHPSSGQVVGSPVIVTAIAQVGPDTECIAEVLLDEVTVKSCQLSKLSISITISTRYWHRIETRFHCNNVTASAKIEVACAGFAGQPIATSFVSDVSQLLRERLEYFPSYEDLLFPEDIRLLAFSKMKTLALVDSHCGVVAILADSANFVGVFFQSSHFVTNATILLGRNPLLSDFSIISWRTREGRFVLLSVRHDGSDIGVEIDVCCADGSCIRLFAPDVDPHTRLVQRIADETFIIVVDTDVLLLNSLTQRHSQTCHAQSISVSVHQNGTMTGSVGGLRLNFVLPLRFGGEPVLIQDASIGVDTLAIVSTLGHVWLLPLDAPSTIEDIGFPFGVLENATFRVFSVRGEHIIVVDDEEAEGLSAMAPIVRRHERAS